MPHESSYAIGSHANSIEQPIGTYLERLADTFESGDALISRHQNRRYTYRDLQIHVEHAARGLLALGLAPGERLGIWSTNRVEWLVTQFATASIGAIAVAINPAYRRRELEFVLDD